MTWNIDRGTELSRQLNDLREHPADILMLQEVDQHTNRSGNQDETAEIAHGLHKNGVFGVEFEELGQEQNGAAYIGQATFTNLPVRRSRILRFKNQSGFWKPHGWLPNVPFLQRREGGRMVLVTEVEYTGKLLVLYNAHLESRSYGRIQMQQIDEMLADMQQYPPGTAFVIAGDLNSKYFPSVYLRRLKTFGFQSAMGNRTPITHNIPTSLDWIFVKGLRVRAGKVEHALKGSDHYAVYATVAP